MRKIIAILGEYNASFRPHEATNAAIAHSSALLGHDMDGRWISTEHIDGSLFDGRYAGIWIAPGSPYKNMDNALWAIREAREHGVPCLGTCGGFQHMILEYARNVLGFQDAQHAEYDPYASCLFISKLTCSLAGRAMELQFTPRSRIASIYAVATATEQYYCNFGVNPDFLPMLKSGSLQLTAFDSEGEARVIELPDHPFFIGTLFVPQVLSTPQSPHPIVTAFLSAAVAARVTFPASRGAGPPSQATE